VIAHACAAQHATHHVACSSKHSEQIRHSSCHAPRSQAQTCVLQELTYLRSPEGCTEPRVCHPGEACGGGKRETHISAASNRGFSAPTPRAWTRQAFSWDIAKGILSSGGTATVARQLHSSAALQFKFELARPCLTSLAGQVRNVLGQIPPASQERQISHRHVHQGPAKGVNPTERQGKWVLQYEGTVSATIQTLKMVSITTATLSLLGSPAYLYCTLDGSYTAAKVLAASGFMCFGVFTTGTLPERGRAP
jgi:hypothetical protein